MLHALNADRLSADLHPYGSPESSTRPPHAAQFTGYTADLLTEQSVDRPVPTARPDVHDQLLVVQ